MTDLVDKDIKIVIIILLYMFKKLEDILSMLTEYMENANTHTHKPLNQTAEDRKDNIWDEKWARWD